jgi:transposase
MAKIRRKLPEGILEQLQSLLKQCRNERETRRVQVILLYVQHGWGYEQVAEATGYSVSYVAALQTAFFQQGSEVLLRRQKHAERRQYLKRPEEAAFLERFTRSAEDGELVTIADIKQAYEAQIGREVALSTIYRLLGRHQWRKVVARPKHPQSDPQERERFKKNPSDTPQITSQSQAHWAPPAGDVPG